MEKFVGVYIYGSNLSHAYCGKYYTYWYTYTHVYINLKNSL